MDTLKYAKILENVGFSREQAETTVDMVNKVMEDKMATKQDIKDLRAETHQLCKDLRAEMHEIRKDLRAEIHELRLEICHKIEQLESKLTIKLGALMVTGIAVVSALKFF